MLAITTGKLSTIELMVIIRMMGDIYCPEDFVSHDLNHQVNPLVQDGLVLKDEFGNLSFLFSHDDGGSYVPNELREIGLTALTSHKEDDDANDVYDCQVSLPQGVFNVHQVNRMNYLDDEGGYNIRPVLTISSFDKEDTYHDINHQDNEGRTLLHYAVKSNLTFATKYLLSKGADQSIVDNQGRPPSDKSYLTSKLREEIHGLLLEDRVKSIVNQASPATKARRPSL